MRLLTIKDVCDMYGISRHTFDQWRAKGLYREAIRAAKQSRYQQKDIDKFLEETKL